MAHQKLLLQHYIYIIDDVLIGKSIGNQIVYALVKQSQIHIYYTHKYPQHLVFELMQTILSTQTQNFIYLSDFAFYTQSISSKNKCKFFLQVEVQKYCPYSEAIRADSRDSINVCGSY